jgi:hypothetical protein
VDRRPEAAPARDRRGPSSDRSSSSPHAVDVGSASGLAEPADAVADQDGWLSPRAPAPNAIGSGNAQKRGCLHPWRCREAAHHLGSAHDRRRDHRQAGPRAAPRRRALSSDLGRGGGRDRPAGTCIYFLLKAGDRSHWHRVDAAEIWHFYSGAPLVLCRWRQLSGARRSTMSRPRSRRWRMPPDRGARGPLAGRADHGGLDACRLHREPRLPVRGLRTRAPRLRHTAGLSARQAPPGSVRRGRDRPEAGPRQPPAAHGRRDPVVPGAEVGQPRATRTAR